MPLEGRLTDSSRIPSETEERNFLLVSMFLIEARLAGLGPLARRRRGSISAKLIYGRVTYGARNDRALSVSSRYDTFVARHTASPVIVIDTMYVVPW